MNTTSQRLMSNRGTTSGQTRGKFISNYLYNWRCMKYRVRHLLRFAAVGIQTTEPNLTNGALAASWILGGGPGVCFKLIYAVLLCLPSKFENCIF